MQLGQRRSAWLELAAFMQDDLGNRLRRENVQVDSGAVLERLSVLEQGYLHFNLLGPFEGSRRGQRHAAGKLFQLHSRQIEGRALAGAGLLGRRTMHLHAAHSCTPRTLARWCAGNISTSSSFFTLPAMRVPVTTAPKPFITKTRSIGRRNNASVSRAGTSAARRAISRFNSSRPVPFRALTATIG